MQIGDNKRVRRSIYFLLIGVTLFLRLWELDSIPIGINLQEAGMGYDAFCLAAFGTDRYTYPHPLFFLGYGDGQGAIYTYLVSFLIRFVGTSVYTLRIPMAFLSLGTLVLGMQCVYRMQFGAFYEYLFGTLYTILPVFVATSRVGNPANAISFFSLLMLYFLSCKKEGSNILWQILAGIATGLVWYTSGMAFLFLPIFLIFYFAYSFRCTCKTPMEWFVYGVSVFVTSIPALLMAWVNVEEKETIRLWKFSVPNLFGWTVEDLHSYNLKGIDMAFVRIFSRDQFGIYSNGFVGMFTWIGLLLAIIGFVMLWSRLKRSIKECRFDGLSLFWLWSVAIIIGLGFVDENNVDTWHIYGILVPVLVMIVYGTKKVIEYLKPKWQICVELFVLFGFLFFSGIFIKEYYTNAEAKYSFQPVFFEGMSFYLGQQELSGRRLYIIDYKEANIYYDLSSNHNPHEAIENVTFGYSGEADPTGVYIVSKPYYEMIEQLKAAGLNNEISYDDYKLIYR